MMTDKEKLAHLVHHWIEHNEAHMEEYKKWASIADKEGLNKMHGLIMEAVKGIDDANKSLHRALEMVKH